MMVDYYVAKACQWDLAGGRNPKHSATLYSILAYVIVTQLLAW
jgi:hypothetical protein